MVLVEVLVAGQDLRLELVGGSCSNEVNGTARCVSPVESALRSAKDFDPLKIDLIEPGGSGACLIDAVNIDGHAGLRGHINQIHPDATDGDLSDADGVARLQIRRLKLQVLDIADSARLNVLRSEGGDCGGNFLDGLFALFCRHDNFRQAGRAATVLRGGVWARCLSPRRSGEIQGGHAECQTRYRHPLDSLHNPPPPNHPKRPSKTKRWYQFFYVPVRKVTHMKVMCQQILRISVELRPDINWEP